ncbi:MAG: hypothetical protein MUP11_09770 [Anaerolineales bacterium]|nr:hypothetical protein [Anaerolineales bacterium]
MSESLGHYFCPGGNPKFGENTADVGFDGGWTYGQHQVRGRSFRLIRIGRA